MANGTSHFPPLSLYNNGQWHLSLPPSLLQVFHPDTCDGAAEGEDSYAWTLPYFHAPCYQWGSLPCRDKKPVTIPSWRANTSAADGEVPDGMIAKSAIAQLEQLVAARVGAGIIPTGRGPASPTRIQHGRPWFLVS
jgi:hypothetical protein